MSTKKLINLEVVKHEQIADITYKLVVKSDQLLDIKPGQFAMLKVDGKFLKRPLSISDFDQDTVTFIYKVLGRGTKLLSESKITMIEGLLPLGNGFELVSNQTVDIIAGGVGIAPMHSLVKALKANGSTVNVHLGYKTKSEVFLADEISEYGSVTIYTEDGSIGTKGYCIPKEIADDSFIYGCGPYQMLNVIGSSFPQDGQLSTEEFMACGFGICAGCVIKLKSGYKKVCTDGPVFKKEEFDER